MMNLNIFSLKSPPEFAHPDFSGEQITLLKELIDNGYLSKCNSAEDLNTEVNIKQKQNKVQHILEKPKFFNFREACLSRTSSQDRFRKVSSASKTYGKSARSKLHQ